VYAVANGRKTGIYSNWPDCEREVKGYQNAKFKKFKSIEDAKNYIKQNQVPSPPINKMLLNINKVKIEPESKPKPEPDENNELIAFQNDSEGDQELVIILNIFSLNFFNRFFL